MVTSEQLIEIGGIDRRLLTQLQQAGVIPKPIKRTAPAGRGLRAYWPDSTAQTLREVGRLRELGRTVGEITAALTNDANWGAASERARELLPHLDREFKGDDGAPTTGRQYFREQIAERLGAFGVKAEYAIKDAMEAGSDRALGWAMSLLLWRIAPVLVIPHFEPLYVTADFLVSHELAVASARNRETAGGVAREGVSGGAIVIPLVMALLDAFKRCNVTIAYPVRTGPGQTVQHFEDDATVERRFSLVPLPSGVGGTYAFSLNLAGGRVVEVKPGEERTPRGGRRGAVKRNRSR